jgi:hypothetical protein
MRRLGTEEGQKAIRWWSEYNRLQAPNRHALFGATLTGNELKNYQEFTAKKSDDPKVVLNQVIDQLNYTEGLSRQRKRSYESAGYTVPTMDQAPSFSNTYGEPTPSTTPGSTMPEAGGATPAAPKPQKYTVGQQITGRDGKKYKVTRLDPNNPDDPDVEEIR